MVRLTDDAELVVSELVTNAVKATDITLHLWLASDHERLVIMVWDSCPRRPVVSEPAEDSPEGRGLMIVEAIAPQWGSYPVADGKIVWALVGARPAP